MRNLFLNFIFCGCLFLSCQTSEKAAVVPSKPGLVGGRLTNLSGLDGCGWVITLNEKNKEGAEKLEPNNLTTFDLTLVDGQAVEFSYELASGKSICMVGPIVTLKQIQIKN